MTLLVVAFLAILCFIGAGIVWAAAQQVPQPPVRNRVVELEDTPEYQPEYQGDTTDEYSEPGSYSPAYPPAAYEAMWQQLVREKQELEARGNGSRDVEDHVEDMEND